MENLFIYNIIKEVMSEIVDQLEIEKYILLTDDKKKIHNNIYYQKFLKKIKVQN